MKHEETEAKKELAITQIRTAANNLYKAADNSGTRSAEWKAARVLNSLSNALQFGTHLYAPQLEGFIQEFIATGQTRQ